MSNAKQVAEYRRRRKQQAIWYKGGKCAICGYDRCPAAMHFHHVDPSQKSFSISEKGNTKRWETIRDELDKCILLCANCHAEVEAGFIGL